MNIISCKKILMATGGCVALLLASQSQAQNVGLSVQFGQPGYYGHVDIGNFPQPQLIYRQPRIVQRVEVVQDPLYLVVPPGHRNNWDKHCYRYNACDRQVYFVQQNWYNNQVVPRYRDGYFREHGDDRHEEHDRGHDRGHDREHGEDHGHGRGRD